MDFFLVGSIEKYYENLFGNQIKRKTKKLCEGIFKCGNWRKKRRNSENLLREYNDSLCWEENLKLKRLGSNLNL